MPPEPQLHRFRARPRPTKLDHQTRPRRHPRPCGCRRPPLSQRLPVGERWVPRRLDLFHPLRLSDQWPALAEHERTGRIVLHVLWSARARRLLPAALCALSGSRRLAAADADQVRALRADGLAALGYAPTGGSCCRESRTATLSPPLARTALLEPGHRGAVLRRVPADGRAASPAAGRGSRRLFAAVLAGSLSRR